MWEIFPLNGFCITYCVTYCIISYLHIWAHLFLRNCSRHRPPKQNKTARCGAAVFTDWLHCTWDFSSHAWLRGSMFFVTCQIHVSRPDSGDFLAFTSLLFPPFLQWIIFFCFHLPCSGNNKADFYLYAQMLGRSNLVGLLYISPSLLFLSFLFPPCPPCLSMCHWTI